MMQPLQMNEERFLGLLEGLIGQVETLQNNPSQGLVPREDNASDLVLKVLEPFTKEKGGPLIVERVHFNPGRGNVIIKYPGTGDKTVCFVGSHLGERSGRKRETCRALPALPHPCSTPPACDLLLPLSKMLCLLTLRRGRWIHFISLVMGILCMAEELRTAWDILRS
jgi:hypothetical protein